jgi:regulator of sigma E protease
MSFGAAILALAVLILLHEAGHFFAARAVGMKPRRFYLGFPPAILKRTRNGVEYGIGAIPLGGYVKIPGMHRAAPGDLRGSIDPEIAEAHSADLDELDAALARGDEATAGAVLARLEPELGENRMFKEQEDSLAPDAYWRQKTWKRVVVIGAGPGVNALVALVLFITVFMIATSVPTRTVAKAPAGWPAKAAGIRAGDKVVAIGAHKVTPDTLAGTINATHGKPVTVTILRDGKRITAGPLKARYDPTEGTYRIGIQIKAIRGPGESLLTATGDSLHLMRIITTGTIGGLAHLLHGQDTHQVQSTVGIVKDTAQAYRASVQDFLFIVGEISLALALLNLLPILPLDGGHIVMSILEAIRRRPFSQLAYLRYSAIGMALFIFLLYLGLRNDLFTGHS